jgi:hypothetical protein
MWSKTLEAWLSMVETYGGRRPLRPRRSRSTWGVGGREKGWGRPRESESGEMMLLGEHTYDGMS